jgi:DNA primase catalytic subunit
MAQSYTKNNQSEQYAKWLAFPVLLRRLTPIQIQELGMDPNEIESYLMVKSRIELAKYFKVGRKQLYRWVEKEGFRQRVWELEKEWGSERTPNVLLGLYRAAVREGDAARVKLWLEYFREWQEKQEVRMESNDIKTLTEEIKKLAEKKYDEPGNDNTIGNKGVSGTGSEIVS